MRWRSEEGVSALFERFTERARQVVVLAQDEARALKHNYIGTEHILLGLLREEEAWRPAFSRASSITVEEVRAQVARIVGQGDEVTTGQIPFTPRAKKVPELALRGALSGTTTSARSTSCSASCARTKGSPRASSSTSTLTQRRFGNEIIRMLSARAGGVNPAAALLRARRRRASKLLDQFGRNPTKLAAEGKLDPVGRQTEIERVMQISSRRTKNNPVLIGEPGVGKTAVVEGLAARISSNQVPELLKGKQIYTLDRRRSSQARNTGASSRSV